MCENELQGRGNHCEFQFLAVSSWIPWLGWFLHPRNLRS